MRGGVKNRVRFGARGSAGVKAGLGGAESVVNLLVVNLLDKGAGLRGVWLPTTLREIGYLKPALLFHVLGCAHGPICAHAHIHVTWHKDRALFTQGGAHLGSSGLIPLRLARGHIVRVRAISGVGRRPLPWGVVMGRGHGAIHRHRTDPMRAT